MAAEAAGSSGGSAESYIGSLISLTSKSEIRYEGILLSISTEESSIGLRNVRSFGTEGRKKDGPQILPSDKVYDYILFRGSDIKDLQVKSAPPVQSTAPIHSDPAIIQSQYPQAAVASSSLPPSVTGSVPTLSSHTAQLGLPAPTFQGSLPLYQPGGSLVQWGSSAPPTTNGGGLAMPMYWPGFYGPSNGLQTQQQPLLRPPTGFSMPPSMQQSIQYPAMNASLPTGVSSLPASQLSGYPPPLLPPFNTSNLHLQSPMLPAQSSATVSDLSTNLISNKASAPTLTTAALSTRLPSVSQLTTVLDQSAITAPVSDNPKTVIGPTMPLKFMSEPASSIVGTSSSILKDGAMPSLVTPDQLLQPGAPTLSSSQSAQKAQKEVKVVQVSSSESPPTSPQPAAEAQEQILPLPSPPERKLHDARTYTQHSNRGRERGRGNGFSRYGTRFTEDFDFIAMNEKFNKDEVWGHLGKSNVAQDGDDSQDEGNAGPSNFETTPVYVKDDFFDSLSCGALDGGSRGGRARFSEQLRRDTETFGDFPRHRGGRGGRGPIQGGRSRGPYYGRSYGYVGRGYGRGYGWGRGGYNMVNPDT